jgi:hypothetical protein
MRALGILTKAQKRPPAPIKVRQGIDGKPNPGDMETGKMMGGLQQKYQESLAASAAAGPANAVNEADPMMKSQVTRAQPFKR